MTADRNSLPWCAIQSRPMPAGTVVCPAEAQALFGRHWDPGAAYIACGDGTARRVVTEDCAREQGLNWIMRAEACRNGHFALRRLRRNGPPACRECERASKRRARQRRSVNRSG
ncbi:MAG: hypothetical protein HRT60_07225 [Dinoroseobacter sp.]|nr:hypothetical protein [Dinoroseobacter sp.]